jgi:uracil-DNA glycosylase
VLPLGPRPVFRVSATARVLIIGQAPGTRVHETGIPWNDPSGDRLRAWLEMSREDFYDQRRIAIVGMGLWHTRLIGRMPRIRLTLLVGGYAQIYVLGRGTPGKTMTERVRGFHETLPRYFPLPHPSWRTTAWERRNPWFAATVLPALRHAIAAALT